MYYEGSSVKCRIGGEYTGVHWNILSTSLYLWKLHNKMLKKIFNRNLPLRGRVGKREREEKKEDPSWIQVSSFHLKLNCTTCFQHWVRARWNEKLIKGKPWCFSNEFQGFDLLCVGGRGLIPQKTRISISRKEKVIQVPISWFICKAAWASAKKKRTEKQAQYPGVLLSFPGLCTAYFIRDVAKALLLPFLTLQILFLSFSLDRNPKSTYRS